MTDVTFTANIANMGGAIYSSKHFEIENGIFTDNSSNSFGAVIQASEIMPNESKEIKITHATFSGNRGTNLLQGGPFVLTDVDFYNNAGTIGSIQTYIGGKLSNNTIPNTLFTLSEFCANLTIEQNVCGGPMLIFNGSGIGLTIKDNTSGGEILSCTGASSNFILSGIIFKNNSGGANLISITRPGTITNSLLDVGDKKVNNGNILNLINVTLIGSESDIVMRITNNLVHLWNSIVVGNLVADLKTPAAKYDIKKSLISNVESSGFIFYEDSLVDAIPTGLLLGTNMILYENLTKYNLFVNPDSGDYRLKPGLETNISMGGEMIRYSGSSRLVSATNATVAAYLADPNYDGSPNTTLVQNLKDIGILNYIVNDVRGAGFPRPAVDDYLSLGSYES
jgi:predicted outer membrane repeat protein